MNKKYSLLFAALITILIFSNFYFFNSISAKETAVVSRVIDGDTIVLQDGRTLRLLNINAPEKNTIISSEATNFLKAFENKSIEIQTEGEDKYYRTLARLYSSSSYSNSNYLNLLLVKEGLASKFLVSQSELSLFSNAEKSAIENSKGIWQKSPYYGCFSIKIDAKKELVFLENSCKEINLNKWMLKDESRKTYTFSSINFSKIIIHSSSGKDNSTDLFWNSGDIWNNDRDTGYLFDSQWGLVSYETYGY